MPIFLCFTILTRSHRSVGAINNKLEATMSLEISISLVDLKNFGLPTQYFALLPTATMRMKEKILGWRLGGEKEGKN
jgi:hypothetical protein